MFTPADMERMPKGLEQLFADLELRIMQDIVRRVRINGDITRSADWQIYRLHELGESKRVIKKMLRDTLKLSNLEIKHIYKDVIRSGYAREEELYKSAGKPLIPFENNLALQQTIKAVREQTMDELKNITRSLGFAEQINGKIQFTGLADFYQKTLDAAMVDVSSGAFDYNTVIKRTIATMTNSGIRSVDYASGWSNRVEVAARRAVMTGITQVTGKINEENAEKLGTDHFEISWHGGARPTHQVWQGRVYSKKELETICGLGTVDGLGGANCRHTWYPFIPGIDERTYTDEQLEEMNARENEPKDYNGKGYTTYEATQKQRRMETTMRAQRQKIKLLQDGGADENDVIAARCRYRKTMSDYVDFSKQMGLPQQRERIYSDGLGNVGVGKTKKTGLRKVEQNDIMDKNVAKEVVEVHSVGKIDKDIYKCVTEDIKTDEVIITDERIQHIKDRHPNDYERFCSYMPEIIKNPDYIIKANKPNTATVLKQIEENGEKFQLVLRIITSNDDPEFKNSVITFLNINERTWNKYLRNKEILYKRL